MLTWAVWPLRYSSKLCSGEGALPHCLCSSRNTWVLPWLRNAEDQQPADKWAHGNKRLCFINKLLSLKHFHQLKNVVKEICFAWQFLKLFTTFQLPPQFTFRKELLFFHSSFWTWSLLTFSQPTLPPVYLRLTQLKPSIIKAQTMPTGHWEVSCTFLQGWWIPQHLQGVPQASPQCGLPFPPPKSLQMGHLRKKPLENHFGVRVAKGMQEGTLV